MISAYAAGTTTYSSILVAAISVTAVHAMGPQRLLIILFQALL
jgi:hypothetical protein